jgi:hypothetical protein
MKAADDAVLLSLEKTLSSQRDDLECGGCAA